MSSDLQKDISGRAHSVGTRVATSHNWNAVPRKWRVTIIVLVSSEKWVVLKFQQISIFMSLMSLDRDNVTAMAMLFHWLLCFLFFMFTYLTT